MWKLSYASGDGFLLGVFGEICGLAGGTEQASVLPLRETMQDTTLVLGGKPMPLAFASPSQVNAQVPYGIPPGSHQLIARRGNRVSVPQSVTVASSDPGIFTVDGTGKGQGHIYTVAADGIQLLANTESPAKPGDVLVIYCTGLGEVLPPLIAGAAAPSDVLRSTSSALTITIGGVTAPVAFAGLTPGSVGLYQVNAVVPPGVPSGREVQVVLSLAGNPSPPVGMAIR